ncbi:MAG: winged helix-turn-helix transcriptional regulator [Desulfovibrionaceae bacterium]
MPDNRTNKISCNNYTYELEVSFEIFSGKWVPHIIWLLSKEEKRFGELKKAMPNVTPKMLSQQLRMLERYGIVNRKAYPEVPPVVVYSLTQIGQKVIPVFQGLNQWGSEYLEARKSGGLSC